MMTRIASVLVVLMLLTGVPSMAQRDEGPPERGAPEGEGALVRDVAPDTLLRPASESFDPLHAFLSPGRTAAYLLTPGTTPQQMRSLILQEAVLCSGCTFGTKLSDGSPVTGQPYWSHVPDLEALSERLSTIANLDDRKATVAILSPRRALFETSEGERNALRAVMGHLMSIQVSFNVIEQEELPDFVTEAGTLEVVAEPERHGLDGLEARPTRVLEPLPAQTYRALILPRVTVEDQGTVEAIRKLVAGGTTVIATHAVPAGPEGAGNWAEETFGVKSIDDIDEAVHAKGSAIVIPAELGRLNPILNGLRCENLFLYPPSGNVLSARFVQPVLKDHEETHLLFNADDFACHTYLTLYGRFEVEVWDLDTDERRIAPGARYTEDGTTLLPLVLEPQAAVALVCRKAPEEPSDHTIAQAPGLERVALTERGGKVVVTGLARLNGTHTVMLATGKKGKAEVRDLPPPLIIDGAWGFRTAQPFDRQPTQISQARVRAVQGEEDTAGWSAADLDAADWDLLKIGDPLPSLAPKWHAKWLTYEGDGVVRYFRRSFEVPGAVQAATLSVTADNGYEVYLNGEQLGADGDWYTAETFDIAGKLKQGANAIAIRVTNEGSIAGLLCEARVTLENGDLIRIVTDESWRMTGEPGEGWQATDLDDTGWGDPQVGGSPPGASPWGEVSGLPEEPNTGREIWYRFDLPPGAAQLRLPQGATPLGVYVGDVERTFDGLQADLGKPKPGVQRAALVIAGPQPLAAPIECDGDPQQILVGDWATQGLAGYAGQAAYERVLDLPDEYTRERLFLDLGDVGVCASVKVNGKDVGTRIAAPYVFDLGKQVKKGKNRVRITVANTLAGGGGILGPVMLRAYREVEVVPE